MTAILVLTMFVLFFVIEPFDPNEAAKYELQSASRAKAGARETQSMAASYAASYEVPAHRFQVRAGIDRRQADRRSRKSQSAA